MKNEFCINTFEHGTIWGELVDWIKINKIARSGCRFVSDLRYCGNHMDYTNGKVYAVFYTDMVNYIVPLHE